VSVEIRLTAEQLAALEPGDTVTIESEASFGRPRHATGTIARVAGPGQRAEPARRHASGAVPASGWRPRGRSSRAELVNSGTA
jgi:hypothetical protein